MWANRLACGGWWCARIWHHFFKQTKADTATVISVNWICYCQEALCCYAPLPGRFVWHFLSVITHHAIWMSVSRCVDAMLALSNRYCIAQQSLISNSTPVRLLHCLWFSLCKKWYSAEEGHCWTTGTNLSFCLLFVLACLTCYTVIWHGSQWSELWTAPETSRS